LKPVLIFAGLAMVLATALPLLRAGAWRIRWFDCVFIELRCLHPRPPAPQEAAEATERNAELLVVGKDLKRRQAPAIGDLNEVAWSRTSYELQDVGGLRDPRIGRGFFRCTSRSATSPTRP
jgi:endonuclease/exonuclease/phosphatase (EEP) superfamily protein YafD